MSFDLLLQTLPYKIGTVTPNQVMIYIAMFRLGPMLLDPFSFNDACKSSNILTRKCNCIVIIILLNVASGLIFKLSYPFDTEQEVTVG